MKSALLRVCALVFCLIFALSAASCSAGTANTSKPSPTASADSATASEWFSDEVLKAYGVSAHMSAALAHFGNASYYLGGENKVSVDELSAVLKNVESRDDNLASLRRTVEHLEKNGVDLGKTPLTLGPQLAINPEKECFADESNADAAKWLTREWREGFECPSAENV